VTYRARLSLARPILVDAKHELHELVELPVPVVELPIPHAEVRT
jgi:hypothetical protein